MAGFVDKRQEQFCKRCFGSGNT